MVEGAQRKQTPGCCKGREMHEKVPQEDPTESSQHRATTWSWLHSLHNTAYFLVRTMEGSRNCEKLVAMPTAPCWMVFLKSQSLLSGGRAPTGDE